ncbi:MAG: hypothetical protein A2Z72_04215 [Omnitrophica bacterium RBG_13_46_9]|nr:MAG: hypothetical protein A2Z72_04215 [Omnitrophica bacterium RBG_13_46_9]
MYDSHKDRKLENINMAILTPEQRYNRRQIMEHSYRSGLSHLGSCLSAVDIIDSIYRIKKKDEQFVLSNGHSGIALYVILEKYGLMKKSVIEKLCIHPDRNPGLGICVSTGSLGHGLPIALGIALADRKKNVYCVISDGECSEGSVWEALRIGIEREVSNLKIALNANGWGAYGRISLQQLLDRIIGFGYAAVTVNGHNMRELSKAFKRKTNGKPLLIFAKTSVEQFSFLKGQDAHYYMMTEEDYKSAMDILK